MLQPTNPEFSRNLGFYSLDEQERFNTSTVAIAGAGGDGGMLAVQLARLGVGELRLADPDPFEVENLNRQAVCTTDTVGVNKATAVGEYVTKINPDIKVVTYTEGINPDNASEFVQGSDLLIDETEFTMQVIGVMLAREARKAGISNLMAMNIGFGGTVTAFHPNGRTFEKTIGVSETAPIDEVKEAPLDIARWLPYLPPYADLDVFTKVATGEKSAPSVVQGVGIAASMAAVQASLHLLEGRGNNRPKPVYAPKVMMYDAMTGESRVIKHPIAAHKFNLIRMAVNNKLLHRAPKASY